MNTWVKQGSLTRYVIDTAIVTSQSTQHPHQIYRVRWVIDGNRWNESTYTTGDIYCSDRQVAQTTKLKAFDTCGNRTNAAYTRNLEASNIR